MTNELIKKENQLSQEIINALVINGDCSKMNQQQRAEYYLYRCRELSIDPAEQPFDYIPLGGKLVLYAKKSCTDALCRNRKLKREIMSKEKIDDVYVVVARATEHDTGRCDESTGAVSIGNLKGDALCNAIMKAETKAKRRSVLSLCGLGMLDESELETIHNEEKPTVRNLRTVPPVVAKNAHTEKGLDALEAEFKEEDKRSEKEKMDAIFNGDDIPDFNNSNMVTKTESPVSKVNKYLPPITDDPVFIPDLLCDSYTQLTEFKGIRLDAFSHEQTSRAFKGLAGLLVKVKTQEGRDWCNKLMEKLSMLTIGKEAA